MSALLIYVVLFLLLIAYSLPIAFALGISTLSVFVLTGQPLDLFTQRMWTGLDKFTLVAIPLFILAGELMGGSGILMRLMDFARLMVGRVRGGLLYINILVSMFFGGVNGSAVADTSAIGSMMIKPTAKEYNDPDTAAAITASSSIVGPVIPPSLPMLIYVFAAGNVSVAGMFIAGLIPGIMLGLAMLLVTFFITKKKNYPADGRRYTWGEIFVIIRRFAVAAILPIIMVAGIVGGVASPTEAGCIGVLYALAIGFFVTRELTFKAVYEAMVRTIGITSIVMIMISIGNVAIWWLTMEGIPAQISSWFQGMTDSSALFLLLMIIFYLLIGLFIEQAAAIVMLVPVFAPLASTYGVDPLHFGVFTCLALAIGLITPPVGLCSFVASSIAGIPVQRVFRASTPFLVAIMFILLIVAFLPQTFLWLPRMLGLS
ncbi:TRAP transporter large permease [Paenibacillus sp. 1P07SE]|uniref:TRAP transporter large permease n=1 Tax=Paenibacillus sp. 1P07SE TaxID=3132209 RepID=UPI0039A4D64A